MEKFWAFLNKWRRQVIMVAAGVAVLLGGIVAFAGSRYMADNRRPDFRREYTLYVYPEMQARQVLDSICSGAKAIRKGSLRRCARDMKLSERMKVGKYVIKPQMSASYVVRMLISGWQAPHNLTLSGTIRSKERLAHVIGCQMLVDSTAIDTLLRSDSLLAKYGFTSENVFAMFIPDTYQMYWNASAESILQRFKVEYDKFWTEERLQKASSLKLTPLEVSTIASIVTAETRVKVEYPLIAGVYLNRLRTRMKLQADPTVAFCFNYEPERILKKHLEVDSPYNTYKYYGLPPAPINVPQKAALDAVLNADRHGYLYFCASPAFDGSHRFAKTYSEHQRNAREFQKELSRRQREARLAAAASK